MKKIQTKLMKHSPPILFGVLKYIAKLNFYGAPQQLNWEKTEGLSFQDIIEDYVLTKLKIFCSTSSQFG